MFNTRNLIIGAVLFVGVILAVILWPRTDTTQVVSKASSSQTQSARPSQVSLSSQQKNSSTVEAQPSKKQPHVDATANQLFQKAKSLEDDGEYPQARMYYQRIYRDHSDFEGIEEVQHRLENINMRIIFSNIPTTDTLLHEVVKGDTLGELAKTYGTTIDLIKRNNGLKNDIIRIGQKLRIWQSPFKIHVDKSQNKLTLKTKDEVMKVYTVSTGTNSSTPVGEFNVTSKLRDPVWFNKGVVVPPESPANVLGTRWLGFDIPGYGIHGTVNPETIGQQVTAGCVRMRNSDVEELYSIIPLGTKVTISN